MDCNHNPRWACPGALRASPDRPEGHVITHKSGAEGIRGSQNHVTVMHYLQYSKNRVFSLDILFLETETWRGN